MSPSKINDEHQENYICVAHRGIPRGKARTSISDAPVRARLSVGSVFLSRNPREDLKGCACTKADLIFARPEEPSAVVELTHASTTAAMRTNVMILITCKWRGFVHQLDAKACCSFLHDCALHLNEIAFERNHLPRRMKERGRYCRIVDPVSRFSCGPVGPCN